MSDDEKVERAFAPGWFQRASEQVNKETSNWPAWKRQSDLQPREPDPDKTREGRA
jgi:hypothetical protein